MKFVAQQCYVYGVKHQFPPGILAALVKFIAPALED
tara:strand:+ start:1031 stop:1138 length:108 start_codon:yes stop_codon:yes gene_type:complete